GASACSAVLTTSVNGSGRVPGALANVHPPAGRCVATSASSGFSAASAADATLRTIATARLEPFDDGASAEPAAAAHGDQAVAAAGPLELVERRRDEAGAGAAGGMPERDGAAVRVHALR